MTKTLTLDEMRKINCGTALTGGTAEQNSEFGFWDSVTWIGHPKYGTGRVFIPGEDYCLVLFWKGDVIIATSELQKA